jgi:DNA repair exonuclease SbcCD ATPase subunit
MDISKNSAHLRLFEDEVVSPFYFNLKGDWSWNLYICFVLKDSDLKQITADRLSLVQRGKRFGKKVIISEEQLFHKLPIATIPKRLNGEVAGDPLKDWQEKLAPNGLLFCLDNFRQQALTEYIDQDISESNSFSDIESTNGKLVPRPSGHIHSLHIGDQFRPHFLSSSPTLDFTQINLLEGPNGMGKTSILECIELAYTGSIQRNLLADRNSTEKWNGRLIIGDKKDEFNEIPAEAEKKIRETAYYKYKVGRRNSQINNAFHQYNYFSSESVHQFCYNTNNQTDYRSAFARVIFGEQLERYEQCINQYRDEFQKKARRLSDDQIKLDAELNATIDDDFIDNEILQERVQYELKSMVNWMHYIIPNYPIPNKTSTTLEVEQWLQHIKPWLHELDVISIPFKNLQHKEVLNGKQLVLEEKKVNAENVIIQKQISDLKKRLEELPQSKYLKKIAQESRSHFEDLRNQQDIQLQMEQKIKELEKVIDQRRSRERRQQIEDKITELNKSNSQLSDILNLFDHLADVELPIMNETELRTKINYWEERRDKAQLKLEDTNNRISIYKNRMNKLQVLLSEMKANAFKYIHEHPEQSNCPLCGYNHETAELLQEAINTSLYLEDDKLTSIMAEQEQIRMELNRSSVELEGLNKVASTIKQLEDARINLLSRKDVDESRLISDSSSLHDVQVVLKNIKLRVINQKSHQVELHQQARVLDQQGITMSAIQELDRLMNDEIQKNYLHRLKLGWTSDELLDLITDDFESLKGSVEVSRLSYVLAKDKVEQIEQEHKDLGRQLDELQKQEKQLRQRTIYLNELRQVLIRLKEKNVLVPEDYSWKDWRQYFDKLIQASLELGKRLEPRILLEEKERQVFDMKNQLEDINNKLKRCNHAINVLSEVRGLAQYGEDFVRSNFEMISQLFVALHSPNEFECLEWTNDDKIIAKRKGSDKKCAIHQMSTGQRTSVILAVFFIMHLVMESAPQFLLLDEPVANMDELNVVGLFDFLRQLTIARGTQLFITTANPQIATLFRRKFSLLGDRFRSFHLRRDIEGPVKIQVKQFLPYQESPIPLQITN